jgi:hypothetical protein
MIKPRNQYKREKALNTAIAGKRDISTDKQNALTISNP